MTLALAAGGFKDTTRVASGNPRLWKDICFSNKEQVIAMIDRFTNCLNEMKRALAEELRPDFEMQLAAAKTVRDQIPAKMKGYWPFLDEIIFPIPDRPGMIGQVAAILGGQDVNIDDIEILRFEGRHMTGLYNRVGRKRSDSQRAWISGTGSERSLTVVDSISANTRRSVLVYDQPDFLHLVPIFPMPRQQNAQTSWDPPDVLNRNSLTEFHDPALR